MNKRLSYSLLIPDDSHYSTRNDSVNIKFLSPKTSDSNDVPIPKHSTNAAFASIFYSVFESNVLIHECTDSPSYDGHSMAKSVLMSTTVSYDSETH